MYFFYHCNWQISWFVFNPNVAEIVTVIKLLPRQRTIRCIHYFFHLGLVEFSRCTVYCMFHHGTNDEGLKQEFRRSMQDLLKWNMGLCVCVCSFVCICLSLYVYFEEKTDGGVLMENRLLALGQKKARESSYQHVGPHVPLHHCPESSITHASFQHCVWTGWCCLLTMSEPTKWPHCVLFKRYQNMCCCFKQGHCFLLCIAQQEVTDCTAHAAVEFDTASDLNLCRGRNSVDLALSSFLKWDYKATEMS